MRPAIESGDWLLVDPTVRVTLEQIPFNRETNRETSPATANRPIGMPEALTRTRQTREVMRLRQANEASRQNNRSVPTAKTISLP